MKKEELRNLLLGSLNRDKARQCAESVRRNEPKDVPMIAHGMPDYHAFCTGYWQECDRCSHYVSKGTGFFCTAWEKAYPGKVEWFKVESEDG